MNWGSKIFGALIVAALFIFSGIISYSFALMVDWSMQLILGYTVTFVLYRWGTRWWPALTLAGLGLFVATILGFWTFGLLPFFGFMSIPPIYETLIQTVNSNDFMWNGLVPFFKERVVPLELIPTTSNPWFIAYAVLIWLGMIPVLGWACFHGMADAMNERVTWYKLFFPKFLRMCFWAVASFVFLVAGARLLVWLHVAV